MTEIFIAFLWFAMAVLTAQTIYDFRRPLSDH